MVAGVDRFEATQRDGSAREPGGGRCLDVPDVRGCAQTTAPSTSTQITFVACRPPLNATPDVGIAGGHVRRSRHVRASRNQRGAARYRKECRRNAVDCRGLPGGATIASPPNAPRRQTGRTMTDPSSPGSPPPVERPSRRPPGLVEGDRRVHEAGRDDGAALGEAGRHARAPSRPRQDGIGLCVRTDLDAWARRRSPALVAETDVRKPRRALRRIDAVARPAGSHRVQIAAPRLWRLAGWRCWRRGRWSRL